MTVGDQPRRALERSRFELAFFRRPEKTFVSAAEYLDLYRQGEIDWVPNIESTGLSLVVDGKEWTLHRRGMGRYPDLIPQLAGVRDRLNHNLAALLRTAVDDVDIGSYFLFEPHADRVLISLFYISETDVFSLYPIPDADPRSGALYDYVRTRRRILLSPESTDAYRFTELPFPKPQLIEALEREVTVGDSILRLPQFR